MGGTGQIGFGPLWRVDGPPPTPQMFGLLQAAMAPAAGVRIVVDVDTPAGPTVVDINDLEGKPEIEWAGALANPGRERWLNGVEVFPYPGDLGDVYDPCAPGSIKTPMGFGAQFGLATHPQFGAMTVWLAETCTSPRVWSQEEYAARASTVLASVEGPAIAKEFLTGLRIPAQPHLSDGNGMFPNGDAVTSVAGALSLLEDVIAASGRLGIIHCSYGAATALRDRFAVSDKSGVLRTINGNVVIADAGYSGKFSGVAGSGGYTGPCTPQSSSNFPSGHQAPGKNQEWMFCSGPIDIRRSEMFMTPDDVVEALDRGMYATEGNPNAITYRAERYYLVDWDQAIQGAVLIDRTLQTP